MSSIDAWSSDVHPSGKDGESLHWAWNPGEPGLFAEAAWAAPRSFMELTDVMVRFLRGGICETPVHLGPTDDETDEIVDYLIRFNRAGFMTLTSQPTDDGPWGHQFAYVEGFATETVAHRIHGISQSGSLGVVLTEPRTTGNRGHYGDAFPFFDGHQSARWIFERWAPAISRQAFFDLRKCWYVVAFDTTDHDPMRLWRNILEALDGLPPGWSRLF